VDLRVAQFDEMGGADGATRVPYQKLAQWLAGAPPELLASRREQAEFLFRRIGITFAVYGAQEATERLIPFDILPRIIARSEWTALERGLVQRVTALNLFLKDIYGAGEILKAGKIPAELVYGNPGYCPEMAGRRVPHDSSSILPASTSCAPTTTASTCSKTTPAPPPASPTCWRTAK
jgi:uncharacterized circularly permuted ATP-grasp superfamily protein